MTEPERVPMDGICACGHAGIDHRMTAPHLCKVIEGMASSLCRCPGYKQKQAPLRPEVPAQRNPGDAETWAGRTVVAEGPRDPLLARARQQDWAGDVRPMSDPYRIVKPIGPGEGAPDLKFEETTLHFSPAPMTPEERAALVHALDIRAAQLARFGQLQPLDGEIATKYRAEAEVLKAARAKAGL